MTNHDPINRPSHYAEGRQYEPIDVIADWNLNYHLGNVTKYISRAGRKQNHLEDLKKARWYLDREIQTLEWAVQPRVTYEDVLEAVAADAAAGQEPLYEYGSGVTLTAVSSDVDAGRELLNEYGWGDVDDQELDYWESERQEVIDRSILNAQRGYGEWDSDDDYMWDPSLGPVELSQDEIDMILRNRDISNSDPDEIVKVIEKRGFLLGVKANGNTCVLNDRGNCET